MEENKHWKDIAVYEYVKESATIQKAKKGDIVQSFDVANPIDKTRGSVIGKVMKLSTGKDDGVEYVHINVFCAMRDGIIDKPRAKTVLAPQNGTTTSLGKKTDGIVIQK